MTEDFQLFTSLRYDPTLRDVPGSQLEYAGWNYENSSPLYMLNLHRDRVLRAAVHWGWDEAARVLEGESGLEKLSNTIQGCLPPGQEMPLRVRVRVSRDGSLEGEISSATPVGLMNLFPKELPVPGAMLGHDSPAREPAYEVVIDEDKTGRSEYTHFKTTRRAMYDEARQRTGIKLGDKKEVLIVNVTDGTVMEGSSTTPYFWRDGRWVTPPVSPRFSSSTGSGGNDGTTRRWALGRGIAVEEEVEASSIRSGEECWLSNGVRGFMFGKVTKRD